MAPLIHKFSDHFEARLRAQLALDDPRTLAAQILALSNFYLQNPSALTPWDQPTTATAYLSYFLPLNLVRMSAAWREVRRFLPDKSFTEIWDFGSGLGATHWTVEDQSAMAPRPFYALERSREAVALHRRLIASAPTRWPIEFHDHANPGAQALGVFSYSFLEMQRQLPDLRKFTHLLIVEPSMREVGRDLMRWRDTFLSQGFQALAPCTHSLSCPLLKHSSKDWCHQRIHFAAPEWWRELESHLPMQNRTLTFSYLLVSRTVNDTAWRGAARAIGDTLPENGKTRQMICRGESREFLSWLHKRGPVPEIPHGALIRGVEGAEIKGNELRPGPLQWEV